MQVNLDDDSNINVVRTDNVDEFQLTINDKVRVTFSRSELKFINALIDSALKEDEELSMESLQQSIKDVVEKNRPKLQLVLRDMKTEDIAYCIWYVNDKEVTKAMITNISKRSAEDVSQLIKEGIERRIRKERAEGNKEIENTLREQGRNAASFLLRHILESK